MQGAFGAVLVSSTKSLLVTVYNEEHERAKVLGVFTATLTAGLAVGLVLGGVITSGLGWRWCLYLNVVFSVFVVIGAPEGAAPAPPSARGPHRPGWSVLFASVGMVGLVYGLGEAASAGWGSGRVVGSLGRRRRPAGRVRRPPVRPRRPASAPAGGRRAQPRLGHGGAGRERAEHVRDDADPHLPAAVGHGLLGPRRPVWPWCPSRSGAVLGSAFLAPRLMRRVPPRWLITAAVVIEAAGLVPLIWLTPHSGYLPLILVATVVEGIGTGLAGPTTLNTALRGVLPADAGAAGAATSAVGQLGSSVGAALFNTIAATVTAGYLAAHPTRERGLRHGARLQRGHGLGRDRAPRRGDPDRPARQRPCPRDEAPVRQDPGTTAQVDPA